MILYKRIAPQPIHKHDRTFRRLQLTVDEWYKQWFGLHAIDYEAIERNMRMLNCRDRCKVYEMN